ncbi:MAG: phytanoyl-CoA dioxygenase family protein [Halioglobus sp.]
MNNDEPLVISDALESNAVLRSRFDDYGYLYFKRYVSATKCGDLLQQFIQKLSPYVGYDDQADTPMLTGAPFFETDPIWDEVYPKLQSCHDFHRFFHDKDIQQLMQKISGEKVFVYPMKMARIATPKKVGYETPPHQDAHSHQAGPTMSGIWVALHDAKKGMGRLKVLPGSHKHGVRNVFQAEGVGGVQCEIFDHEDVWHVSDVECGDVIIFNSCCVHKAEPNTSDHTVRMSIDTRFCDYGAPVFSLNLEPHHGSRIEGYSWESIYQQWTDKVLQYYWSDYPNLFSDMAKGASMNWGKN